jgi:hypothetical protein
MPTEEQNAQFIAGTIAVLRKRGVSDELVLQALIGGAVQMLREMNADANDVRGVCDGLLEVFDVDGMGGCKLCCS